MNDFPAAGGLGAYGSDGSEDERSLKGSDSSDTDEEELRHRIRQKQDAFRRKEQERQELEEHVNTNPGKHHVNPDIVLLFRPKKLPFNPLQPPARSSSPLTSDHVVFPFNLQYSHVICPFVHMPLLLPL